MTSMTASSVTASPTRSAVRSSRKSLRAVHLTVAAGAVGIDLALLALALAGGTGAEPQAVYPAMALIARWVLAPLAVATLLSGVVLAVISRYGLFRYWWVAIKLTIGTVLTALVLFVLVPGFGEAADAAAALHTAALDGRRLALVLPMAIGLPLLLSAVAIAVTKPRWRLRG